MDALAELAASIRRVFPASWLEPVTADQLAAERRDHPDAPSDYLEFLQRVGWGSLGGSNFMIYSGLVGPSDIFDPTTAAELTGVLLLGDDFSGWSVGFDTRAGWRLVGTDHGAEPHPLKQRSLLEYIAQLVADAQDDEPDASPVAENI